MKIIQQKNQNINLKEVKIKKMEDEIKQITKLSKKEKFKIVLIILLVRWIYFSFFLKLNFKSF